MLNTSSGKQVKSHSRGPRQTDSKSVHTAPEDVIRALPRWQSPCKGIGVKANVLECGSDEMFGAEIHDRSVQVQAKQIDPPTMPDNSQSQAYMMAIQLHN
jgi:hypothetical protein